MVDPKGTSQNEAEPRIVVFDATFSNNPKVHQLKTYYQDTIWYRPSLNAPKEVELAGHASYRCLSLSPGR